MSAESKRPEISRGPIVVLSIGVALTLALLTEIPYVNGPEYSRWHFRSLPLDRALVLFAGPLLLYAYLFKRAAAAACSHWSGRDARFIVGGLVVCVVLFQYASVHVDKRGRGLVTEIVTNPGATGYYSNATEITDPQAFLEGFAHAKLHTHSKTHPPGPILYYFTFIRSFGEAHAPWLAGVGIGILASLGVAVLYLFTGLWLPAGSARVWPCFVYALSPALIGFFPELDQVYPLIAMGMILLWSRALARPARGVWLGVLLSVASMLAYNLIAVGAFMALYALWRLHRRSWQRQDVLRCVVAGAIALATALAAHLLLWAATSYHAVDSFQSALAAQAHFSRHGRRPYSSAIFSDPVDFFLGGGMVTLPLMVMQLRSKAHRELTLVALLAILAVDLSGLLRCETARVWLFLQPLAVVPAGLTLAEWDDHDRALVLGLLALIVIVVRCKLRFVL